MLDAAEAVPHSLSKAAYNRALPRLRERLLNAQFALSRQSRSTLLVLLAGIDGGGRSETANTLNAWMDPRHIRTVAFAKPRCEEREHPSAWRYWRALPARGGIGIFTGAWYAGAFRAVADGDHDEFARTLGDIRDLETMLAHDGVLLLKIWIHLAADEAAARVAELRQQRWRLDPLARTEKDIARYFARREQWNELLRTTSTRAAPWFVVNGADPQYRELAIGKLVLSGLLRAAQPPVPSAPTHARTRKVKSGTASDSPLQSLDMSATLSEQAYDAELREWQHRLAKHARRKRFGKRSLILAFEGADAAGKGGAIRRVTGALDARQYINVPISAPDEEERRYPWLWRFWRHVPATGGITIFDRTWYGRVLVERVEGLCDVDDWHRAYAEIDRFERQLSDAGVIICKFWLQVTKAEQLARFHARAHTPYKRFKITADDWRNRRRWDAYQQAVTDMVQHTSTPDVPWTLVASDDKRHARIEVLKSIVARLDETLG
ncbi:MAG: polyphosphate:AMP phosphotransferase [Casimicrobiaceae bacterium]